MKNKCRFTSLLPIVKRLVLGIMGLALVAGTWSCDTKEKPEETEPQMHNHQDHGSSDKMEESEKLYTCPMPEDSVFSDKPGSCPKCGMELIKVKAKTTSYTCPMHPEVISDKPGSCPKCGMDLVPVGKEEKRDTLALLIQPTNHLVISQLKAIVPSNNKNVKRISAEGYLTYDPNKAGTVSSRVSGRIEKLFVRYNFQKVNKGEKLLDIYSPELLTAQNDLLYVMKDKSDENDFAVKSLKSKLINLGMSESAISQLQKSGKANPYVSVFATMSGHVHFLNGNDNISGHAFGVPGSSANTMNEQGMPEGDNQVLREGDYVKIGSVLFTIADQSTIWAVLKVLPADISSIKKGEAVEVAVNGETHEGKVDFIEKSFEAGSDFYTVRVYLPCNDHSKLKIGTLVKGYITIKSGNKTAIWVPALAVLSLGKSKSAVFIKTELGYEAKEIMTGTYAREWVEITNGLSLTDSIAPVASYLVDSEAFIVTE